MELITSRFLSAVEDHPNRPILTFPDETVSYQELNERALIIAKSLHSMDVRRGDHVGILMANSLEYVAVLFGAAFLGAIPVLYNGRFKAREIAHVTSDADIKVIVTSDQIDEHVDYGDLLHSALPGLETMEYGKVNLQISGAPNLHGAVMLGGKQFRGFIDETRFKAMGEEVSNKEITSLLNKLRIEDPAIMFYTSGTTAMPKGCYLNHTVLQHAGVVGGVGNLGLREGDKVFAPLPMFHTAFSQPFSGVLHVGGTLISMKRFEAKPALDLIHKEKPTAMFPAFAMITNEIIAQPEYRSDSFESVRTIVNVGPEDVLMQLQEKMPHTKQITVFGMTETGGSVCMGNHELTDSERARTSGPALPGNEIEIRDPETNKKLPPNTLGEIVARGIGVFSGYHKSPEKNAETFDSEGWFHTGDLGEMTENGEVIFSGRLKDMLKVGGENVASVEVEGFLSTHTGVKVAAIVGLPDEKYGEVPVAYIELEEGSELSEEEIIEYCKGQIASFKIPRHVRFLTEWPMGATKILKYELRETIAREFNKN
ncbi:MAG: class I adenylate-forming enzyme family protein [Acidimicrobiales bacterium]|nr:class I adenylate-forming enzyme family protein [Acidimicrobiales bacterium]